jgi:uncharacterized protein (TIGR03067 family)
MQKQIWLVATFLVLAGVGLVTGGDGKKDEDKIQGTWRAEKDGKSGVMKITGNKFSFSIDDKESHKGTFKINSGTKPKEIDMMVAESPKYAGKTSLAIYELDGDTFKWCANEPGKDDRPKDFSEKYLYLVFKREKK